MAMKNPRPPASPGGSRKPSKENTVQYLFDRPLEPVFLPKGEENVVFDVPDSYLTERYRPNREGIFNRIKDEVGDKISVRTIALPDLSLPMSLGRRDNFSLFIPDHRKYAGRLINILVGMRNLDDFVSASVFCRDRINPYMYVYALSVAVLHRPDTKNVQIPTLCEMFPEKYMDSGILRQAREESNVLDEGDRIPLEIPRDYTASDIDPEHKVAYFREDLGINLHHWHWHLVYPFDADLAIVNKDRRGELFYYMHQQIMARYNLERLCNQLPRVTRLTTFRDPLPEGYFSKLDSLVSSRTWPPRHSNAILSDVYREIDNLKVDLSDLERWRDRILDSIAQGSYVEESGRRVDLTPETGIDVLGNLIEASVLSKNRSYYGDFHNFGHIIIALCHDPDARHLETFGVMGDPATAMRDPIFYRWHAFIDYLFQAHKNVLPPYGLRELDYQGIRVSSLEIQTKGRSKNELSTYWKQDDVDLSRGMDFTPRGNVYARFTHLDHQPFTYKIQVENNTNQPKTGTVRLFLGPKFDERGVPFLFRDQKNLFVELDKFTTTFKNRQTSIERRSDESSVTIPFDRTFRNLDARRPTTQQQSQLDAFNFCGCGWPHHMLIPKGSPDGYQAQLFVMISNIDGDKVEDSNSGGGRACEDAASYCGIRDKKYPDKRAMGFPFDRQPRDGADTMEQFLTPNMTVTDVKIFFTDRTEAVRGQGPGNRGRN